MSNRKDGGTKTFKKQPTNLGPVPKKRSVPERAKATDALPSQEPDTSQKNYEELLKEKTMRRAIYSDARTKTAKIESEPDGVDRNPKRMFAKMATAVRDSVSDIKQKEQIAEMLSTITPKIPEPQDMTLGDWNDIASSLLGSLDSIFMSMQCDPEVNQVIYNTLSAVIQNLQATDLQLANLDY